MVHQDQIELSTRGDGDMHNLTDAVRRIVAASGVEAGMVNVFNIGSTASIGTIEFEPGLQEDLPEKLDELIPPSREYGHEKRWHDGNGHSHLQATTLGPDCTVPVKNGEPVLGTWQQIFHIDCDNKARDRTIQVTVYGE